MMKKLSILKCAACGASVEILTEGTCGEILKCCGQDMSVLDEKTADSATEKHVPVPTSMPSGETKVAVGSVPHPMTPEHHIEWIEIINGPYVNRYHLNPGDAPEALFHVKLKPGMTVREYCNIHGLWVYKT